MIRGVGLDLEVGDSEGSGTFYMIGGNSLVARALIEMGAKSIITAA